MRTLNVLQEVDEASVGSMGQGVVAVSIDDMFYLVQPCRIHRGKVLKSRN